MIMYVQYSIKLKIRTINLNSIKENTSTDIWGTKGVVCGLEGSQLADSCELLKLEECHLIQPSPTHACPRHGPWITLSHVRAQSEFLML